MTDEEQRRLERSAAMGDTDAEVRALVERLRSGELSREGLRLAARSGDAGARRALGDPHGTSVSADFVRRHRERLESILPALRDGLRAGWRADATVSVLGTLAAIAGHEGLAERLFALEAAVACPACGAPVSPLGDLGAGASTH